MLDQRPSGPRFARPVGQAAGCQVSLAIYLEGYQHLKSADLIAFIYYDNFEIVNKNLFKQSSIITATKRQTACKLARFSYIIKLWCGFLPTGEYIK